MLRRLLPASRWCREGGPDQEDYLALRARSGNLATRAICSIPTTRPTLTSVRQGREALLNTT